MNTILEDRLRSHFAEQAARDVLEEPDPRTVMARALAAPAPRPSPGRGGPARRGRALRLTVIGLAAACLLAVVAVVATRDDGGTLDVTEHPTTTTTVRDATTSTTVPETTTTTDREAVVGAAATRSVVVAPLGVLGWWDGRHWVEASQDLAVPLQGGEQYQITRIGGPHSTVTGPAPTTVGCVEADRPIVRLDAFGERTVVGVTGVAELEPRPVTLLDPADYRDEAVAALASTGIDDPAAEPELAVRTDLDGDGSDEVLFQVERVADDTTLLAEEGDYSAVFLRQVVGGEVRTTTVKQSVALLDTPGYGFLLVFDLVAVADLNGDGRMEVVIDDAYYEGSSTAVYELAGDGSLVRVIGAGCGV